MNLFKVVLNTCKYKFNVALQNCNMNIAEFPPFYKTDDYFKCIQNGNTFCIVTGKLSFASTDSSLWRHVMRNETWRIDRSYLHRGVCLPLAEQDTGIQAKNILNDELFSFNLTVSKITSILCQDAIQALPLFDILFLLTVSAILCCIFIGTFLNCRQQKHKNFLKKIIMAFSIKENWREVTKTTGSKDYNKLKSMQGLRFFTISFVVLIHCGVDIILMFYKNPEAIETPHGYLIQRIFTVFTVLIHQIFPLISGFLLAYKMYSHYERNGSFTFKELFIILINRYFRFVIPLALFVFFSQTAIMEPYLGIPTVRIYHVNKQACQTSWLSSVLFYSNFRDMQDICYSSTWYLSADFQAYVLLALMQYIIFKYKMDFIKVISCILLTSIAAFATSLYAIGNPDVLFLLPLRLVINNMIDYESFMVLHTSTYAILPTMITGFLFGYLYFKKRNIDVSSKKTVYQNLWILLFFGLPALSVCLAVLKYNRVLTAAVGSVVKVIFASGIGIGIIGMSKGLGGSIRTFLESKYTMYLGNITFSIYLFNYSVLIFANIGRSELITLESSFVLTKVLLHVSLSVLGGLIFFLAVEQPAVAIQKEYLPQLKKKSLSHQR